MPANKTRLWLARLLVALVLGWNLQCALAFLWAPAAHAPAFEVDGVAGAALLRSLAILFLMWNVPYALALWHPQRHRLSLTEALLMQTIGLLGETLLLLTLPPGHAALRATAQRFILFDGAGLLLLLLARWLVRQPSR